MFSLARFLLCSFVKKGGFTIYEQKKLLFWIDYHADKCNDILNVRGDLR